MIATIIDNYLSTHKLLPTKQMSQQKCAKAEPEPNNQIAVTTVNYTLCLMTKPHCAQLCSYSDKRAAWWTYAQATTESRREKRRDGKHNKQEESSERKSRVINTTRAVSSPLSRPECAFVTAAHSSSRVQSMTTCQASITSKLGTTSCARPEPLIERYARLEKMAFLFLLYSH